MKCLIVDDDFDSRKLLQRSLLPYGQCDIAVDGEEGVEAFQKALRENEPYQFICLDIMMPNMDGQKALREIRDIERDMGVPKEKAVKILMVSGLDDNKELHDAFFLGEATSYIVKPIRKEILLEELKSLGVPLEEKSAD